MKYKIAVVTLCYNEMSIIPFAIDYWKLFADHVYVFDDGSTDGSKEELSKHDWITVIDKSHLSKGEINDGIYTNIKNHFWKVIKDNFDFIVICDMDECIYSYEWDNILSQCVNIVPAIIPNYHNLISEKLPKHNDKLIHTIVPDEITYDMNVRRNQYSKVMILNCKLLYEINYRHGAHLCSPIMLHNNNIIAANVIYINSIHCFHLNDVGLERKLKRYENYGKRLSDFNKQNMCAFHYCEETENTKKNFYKNLESSKQHGVE